MSGCSDPTCALAEHLIRAAGNVIIGPALELIQRDPHQWSERPCSTCRSVSSIVGKPFGCELFRQEKAAKRAAPSEDNGNG